MRFHDIEGHVRYDLTITHGEVSGWQHWQDEAKPVARIVGGWFDYERLRLSVLIQGADHVEARWRSQLKQFHVDIPGRRVVLDHELYDYGSSNPAESPPLILDQLDRVEHLVKPNPKQ